MTTPYIEVQLIAWGRWAAKQAARSVGYPSVSPMFRDSPSGDGFGSSIPFGINEYISDTDKAVQRLDEPMRALCVQVYQIGGTQRDVAARMHTSQSRISLLVRRLHDQVIGHLNDIAAGR